MTTATIATFDRFSEPTIGTYRRSAGCQGLTSSSSAVTTPNYVARRILAGLVATCAVMVLAMGLSGLLASVGGDPAVAADARPAEQTLAPASHVARPGDTLWSIADAYRGEVSHARYVDALVRLNGGASIQAGQAVALP